MLKKKYSLLKTKLEKHKYFKSIHHLQTSHEVAIKEIHVRRNDADLIQKVQNYLQNDIPNHFQYTKPTLYLSRHVATPNYETLLFIDTCHEIDPTLPKVIGQDVHDIFVGNNVLKRNLGKLPIAIGTDKHGKPVIRNSTILDFRNAQGRKISELHTISGTPLPDFHTKLLQSATDYDITLVNESSWIDNHHRGNLLEHYKHILSLFIVHGIMFELYEYEDKEFVDTILIPAYKFVTKQFGCVPLISFLVDPKIEFDRDWNTYPEHIAPLVEKHL